MKIGIVPNILKEKIVDVISLLTEKLKENGLEYALSDSMIELFENMPEEMRKSEFIEHKELFGHSDIILSIGGDGTMLSTAYEAKEYNVPLLGLNFGKLGFLAEFDINNINNLIDDLKNDHYVIDERMGLEAVCYSGDERKLFAINDIVIDKGRWPKMIQLTLKVDEDYVSTFNADGIIIATPTGSTGYSLSTGGPIVSPKANVITVSPISPHTLTMRPLVLASNQKISIDVDSQHTSVQVNCDGQRVHFYDPPFKIEISKAEKSIKLVHTKSTNYFETLRKKLYWGLDVRNNPN